VCSAQILQISHNSLLENAAVRYELRTTFCTGVGMRIKLNWTAVVLAVSLVTLSAIALQANSANQKHRATALALLGDYANFAAFNYSQRAETQLQAIVSRMLHPAHLDGFRPQFRAFELSSMQEIAEGLKKAQCDCMRDALPVTAYFLYSPTLDQVKASPALTAREVSQIRDLVRAGAAGPGNPSEIRLRVLPDSRRMLAYQAVPNLGPVPMSFGVVFETAALAGELQRIGCLDNLLPPTLAKGTRSDSLLTIALYAPGEARPFYSSVAEPKWFQARDDTLSARFGGLVARASIKAEMAERLVIGGLPRSRLPLLLVLFGVSAGLALLAGAQMRREHALMRMRENFVTSVSHELRTPLAQVRLFLETLRMGRAASSAEREWALSHIERETTRLAHLVENVLHVSRPKRADAAVAAPVLDLKAEIDDVVESFQPIARSRRARIVTRLEEGLLTAIRREHLRQILVNLLDNAVKYGPLGQTVTVSTRTASDCVQISVSDEGPGVLPAERERIWKPYFRGSTPEAVASGGTGIGLNIVSDLASTYRGRVLLERSSPGATFVCELPRVQVGPRVAVDNLAAASPAG
jgi:signal transduction histidine kinase